MLAPRSWSVMLIALGAMLGVWPASAQFGPGYRGREMEMPRGEPVEAVGTLEGMMRGAIQVKAAGGELLVFQVAPNAKVRVTGKAEADFLQPGLLVQFKGQLNKQGQVEEPVRELTIFTPSNQRMPGAFPAEMFATAGEGEAKPVFGAPASETRPEPKHGRNEAPSLEGRPLVIAGKISSIKGKYMTLNVPRLDPKFRIELAEELEIAVDINQYSAAKAGDQVNLKGVLFNPKMGRADELTIEMASPLSAPGKKRPLPAAREPRVKPGEQEDFEVDGEEEDAPAADEAMEQPDEEEETPRRKSSARTRTREK